MNVDNTENWCHNSQITYYWIFYSGYIKPSLQLYTIIKAYYTEQISNEHSAYLGVPHKNAS